MPHVTTPSPIVLLDTAISSAGPVIDFGGQEVRFVLVVEASSDFALVDSNTPAEPVWLEALSAAALVRPPDFDVVAAAVPGINIQVRFPKQLLINNISSQETTSVLSGVLFQTKMFDNVPARIAAGSYKVTLYFV